MVEVVPGAGAGDVGDEGVGSHGEPADGFGVGEVLANEVVEQEAGEGVRLRRGGVVVRQSM